MKTTPANAYNYDIFEPAPYVQADCSGPTPGTTLGDAIVERLDGPPIRLAEVADGPLVVETGSTTCPLYRRNIPKMRAVADAHPAAFAMLYTREAHPGERRGAHRDMADKRAAAATLPDAAGEWRQILVDDLDGTLHRRLEGAPDSITVLDHAGTVLSYHHDGDPRAVGAFLDSLEAGRPDPSIRARFVPPAPHVALPALLVGGWQAVRDFARGLPALALYRLRGGQHC
ncbi:hypothetical protein BH23ACT10_BH23ACT10_16490 [soil metagenome]